MSAHAAGERPGLTHLCRVAGFNILRLIRLIRDELLIIVGTCALAGAAA